MNGNKEEMLTSEIPQIFLNASSSPNVVDPFFLSLIINNKMLKNCMIDSGASNTVMPVEIMKAMGLHVDTPHNRCRAMDSREVPVIGTIEAMPYRLALFPGVVMTMNVLVVDIPPHYGMLLSRKLSASMGGSIQNDLSYATFNIAGENFNVLRESRTPHTIEKYEDTHINCCIDMDMDNFRMQKEEPCYQDQGAIL